MSSTYVRITGAEGLPPLSLPTEVWRAAISLVKNYVGDDMEPYPLITYDDVRIFLTPYTLVRFGIALQSWLKANPKYVDEPIINEAIVIPFRRLVEMIDWTMLADGVLNVSAPQEAKP